MGPRGIQRKGGRIAARVVVGAAIAVLTACASAPPPTAVDASTAGQVGPDGIPIGTTFGLPGLQRLKGAPEIGASEAGTDALQVAFEPPHLKFRLMNAPNGTYSVSYLIASVGRKRDLLQVNSVDAPDGFSAKLEYELLDSGEYAIRAFAKGVAEPIDTRKIQVPY